MVAYKVVVFPKCYWCFFSGALTWSCSPFFTPEIFVVGSVILDASQAEVHCRDRGGSPEALRCSPDIPRGVVHMLNAMWDDL